MAVMVAGPIAAMIDLLASLIGFAEVVCLVVDSALLLVVCMAATHILANCHLICVLVVIAITAVVDSNLL